MKLIDDIRRENMVTLANGCGGAACLAGLLVRSEAQVSQWINGSKLPSGKKRGMRSETARWIEAIVGKPEGWLDTDHAPKTGVAEAAPPPYFVKPHHARPLVQQVCGLAERLDDAGLLKLQGYAACLLSDHPLVKAKPASYA